jgi:hypothetical protein
MRGEGASPLDARGSYCVEGLKLPLNVTRSGGPRTLAHMRSQDRSQDLAGARPKPSNRASMPGLQRTLTRHVS